MYYFKRKYRQIKNLIKWIPIIWNQFDFDYRYATDVFKFQLLKMADFMESDKTKCVGAKDRASRIRMIIRLMDKVYDEDYACEYQSKLKELYPKEGLFDWQFVDTEKGDGSSYLKYGYELTESKKMINEINKAKDSLFKESREKQERAHKLLWKLIEHNIRNWWD